MTDERSPEGTSSTPAKKRLMDGLRDAIVKNAVLMAGREVAIRVIGWLWHMFTS